MKKMKYDIPNRWIKPTTMPSRYRFRRLISILSLLLVDKLHKVTEGIARRPALILETDLKAMHHGILYIATEIVDVLCATVTRRIRITR
jgi:hypothetical protein